MNRELLRTRRSTTIGLYTKKNTSGRMDLTVRRDSKRMVRHDRRGSNRIDHSSADDPGDRVNVKTIDSGPERSSSSGADLDPDVRRFRTKEFRPDQPTTKTLSHSPESDLIVDLSTVKIIRERRNLP